MQVTTVAITGLSVTEVEELFRYVAPPAYRRTLGPARVLFTESYTALGGNAYMSCVSIEENDGEILATIVSGGASGSIFGGGLGSFAEDRVAKRLVRRIRTTMKHQDGVSAQIVDSKRYDSTMWPGGE